MGQYGGGFDGYNGTLTFSSNSAADLKVIAEDDHLFAHRFHRFCEGREGVFDGLRDFSHGSL